MQKSTVRKKYATSDEDLFNDSTDIFASISAPRSSQTTDGRLQPPGDDTDGDYDSCY